MYLVSEHMLHFVFTLGLRQPLSDTFLGIMGKGIVNHVLRLSTLLLTFY